MTFFKDLKESLYGPEFYVARGEAPSSEALRYFAKLLLFTALLGAIVFSLLTLPFLISLSSSSGRQKFAEAVPADLSITISHGQASTNVQEPYAIPVPKGIFVNTISASSSPRHANLLVIDTAANPSPDQFKKYDTFMLMTKDYLLTEKDASTLNINKISELPDMTVNRAQVRAWLDKALPYVWLAAVVGFIILYVILIFAEGLSSLFVILISAFIFWFVRMVGREKSSFGRLFKLGFYAASAQALLGVAFLLLGLRQSWYIATILTLIVYFLNVRANSPLSRPNSESSQTLP